MNMLIFESFLDLDMHFMNLYDKAEDACERKHVVCVYPNVASSFWEAQLLVCRCLAKSGVLEGII